MLLKWQKTEWNSVHIDKVRKEEITSDLIFFAIYVNLSIYVVYDPYLTMSGK